MKRLYAACLTLVVGAAAIGAATLTRAPIQITNLRPTVGMEPLVVKALVVIEPNETNRSMCLVVTSDDYATQSCGDIDGINEPRTRQVSLTLPGGEYAITAILYQNTGKVVSANVVSVQVLSRTGAPSGGTDREYSVRNTR